MKNSLSQSLVYKLDLSSTVSHLSPAIDLRTSTVKTISNRIENPTGFESRYGRQNQILELYKVYTLTLNGNLDGSSNRVEIETGQNVDSETVSATSEVAGLQGGSGVVLACASDFSSITVKLKNTGQFKAGEKLKFQSQSASGGNLSSVDVTISDSGPNEVIPTFTLNSVLNGYNVNEDANVADDELYAEKISGTIIDWDVNSRQLVVFNNKQPINDDFTSKITGGSAFNRSADVTTQTPDIFRSGDYLQYVGQAANTKNWWEINKMSWKTGVAYVSEDSSKNTSGIAKYVTKEISLENPGTSIDVKLTANVRNISDIKVLYKFKEESSEINFDDIEWTFFNVDGKADIELTASAENEISGLFEKQGSYQEIPFSVTNLPEFTSFAVKVVMNSDNPSYVPKLQDLRAVASF